MWSAIKHLFRYFNQEEDITDAIREQRDNYYCMPLTAQSRMYNLVDFITYTRSYIKSLGNAGGGPPTTTSRRMLPKRSWIYTSGGCGPSVIPSHPSHLGDRTLFIPPTSVYQFLDVYQYLTQTLASAGTSANADDVIALSEPLRDYTAMFVRGFTESKSRLNLAVQNVMEEFEHLLTRWKGGGDISSLLVYYRVQLIWYAISFIRTLYWPSLTTQHPATADEPAAATEVSSAGGGVVASSQAVDLILLRVKTFLDDHAGTIAECCHTSPTPTPHIISLILAKDGIAWSSNSVV